jgi:O-antigen/teichoic acid export membrane protein
MVVTQRFIYNLTPSILGALVGSVAAAVFGIASTLEGYSYSLGNVLSSMFLPKISRILTGENITNELTELMIKVGRIQLFILGMISIGFASVGLDFIIRWMGLDYKMAYYCAILLITPNLLIWPMMIAATALTAVNRVKEHAIVNVCMAIINIILELCLVPLFGLIGAAIAIGIAYCFRAIAMMYLYKKYLNVRLLEFLRKTYLKFLIPLIIALGISLLECYFITAKSWIMVGVEAICVGFSYITIMYFFVFNNIEKEWIKNRLINRG